MQLVGGPEPTQLGVKRYAVRGEEPHFTLRFEGLEADREWLARLATDFLVGRDLEVPEEHAGTVAWLQRLL